MAVGYVVLIVLLSAFSAVACGLRNTLPGFALAYALLASAALLSSLPTLFWLWRRGELRLATAVEAKGVERARPWD
jgi:hypothetical protein